MNATHATSDTIPAVEALRRKLTDIPTAFAVVVAGPSGVGKTTLCREVLARESDVHRLVTTTTRTPREDEADGIARHFVSESDFRSRLADGHFVEYAEVHGRLYGATLASVYAAMSQGGVMLMDVDVQGVATWQRVLGSRCVAVFVLPPSMDELRVRLDKRQSETAADFQMRMENAVNEMQYAPQCDYAIVNEVLPEAVLDLRAIIRAERNRTERRRHQFSELRIARQVASPTT